MAKVSGVFLDIPQMSFEELGVGTISSGDRGRFKELSIGEGSNVVKADDQGFWIGGETFDTARWRVDMLGNMYWNDGTNDRVFIGEE